MPPAERELYAEDIRRLEEFYEQMRTGRRVATRERETEAESEAALTRSERKIASERRMDRQRLLDELSITEDPTRRAEIADALDIRLPEEAREDVVIQRPRRAAEVLPEIISERQIPDKSLPSYISDVRPANGGVMVCVDRPGLVEERDRFTKEVLSLGRDVVGKCKNFSQPTVACVEKHKDKEPCDLIYETFKCAQTKQAEALTAPLAVGLSGLPPDFLDSGKKCILDLTQEKKLAPMSKHWMGDRQYAVRR